MLGGIHFRFSTVTGAAMGESIARYLLDCIMQPLHP